MRTIEGLESYPAAAREIIEESRARGFHTVVDGPQTWIAAHRQHRSGPIHRGVIVRSSGRMVEVETSAVGLMVEVEASASRARALLGLADAPR